MIIHIGKCTFGTLISVRNVQTEVMMQTEDTDFLLDLMAIHNEMVLNMRLSCVILQVILCFACVKAWRNGKSSLYYARPLHHAAMQDPQDVMQNFDDYCKENRVIQASDVEHTISSLVTSKNARGIRAKIEFKEKDVAVKLQKSGALIAYCSERNELLDTLFAPTGWNEVWKIVKRPTHRLAILLLLEYQRGDKSQVKQYIDFLPAPQEFTTPLHWSPTMLQEFPYKYISESVSLQDGTWKGLYDLIKSKKPEFFEAIPLERFVWALEVVGSRSFKGLGEGNDLAKFLSLFGVTTLLLEAWLVNSNNFADSAAAFGVISSLIALLPWIQSKVAPISTIALLPYIDSANHKSVGFNCDVSYNPITSQFELTACNGISPSTEICISYGKRSNDDWLLNFGFVETENPFDAYVVSNINEKLRELLSQSSEVQRNTGAQLNTIVLESSDIPASLTRVKSKLNEITGRVAADNEAKEVLSNIIKQEKNQINAYLMNHSQEVNDEASTFLTCKVSILDTIERRLNSI